MTGLGPHQLSFYLLTNVFSNPKLRSELSAAFTVAMEQFRVAVNATSKNVRVGYASFILNLAVQAFMVGKIGLETGKREVCESPL